MEFLLLPNCALENSIHSLALAATNRNQTSEHQPFAGARSDNEGGIVNRVSD
jgi:hypothetical protein